MVTKISKQQKKSDGDNLSLWMVLRRPVFTLNLDCEHVDWQWYIDVAGELQWFQPDLVTKESIPTHHPSSASPHTL